MNPLLTLFAAGLVTVAIAGCTQEQEALHLPPGKYEKTVKSTDEHGTTTERTKSTKVTQDQYGNKKAVVESETTEDPKGWFNKKTTDKSKTVIKEQ